jgi:hypothetical protein
MSSPLEENGNAGKVRNHDIGGHLYRTSGRPLWTALFAGGAAFNGSGGN